jgi:hypothetical protein
MKLNYYVSNGTIEKRSKPKFVEPIYNNNFADELGLTIKKFIEIYLDHDYCKDQNENHVNQYSLDSLGFNFTTFADMMLHILIIKLMSQTSNESVSLCNDMLKLLDNLFLVTNSNRDRSSVKNKETVEIENHLLDKFSKFLNNPITDTSNTKLVRELVEASTELLEIRYSSNGKRAKVMYSR